MGLVEAKCTSCGAQLKVESLKDAAICQYCNTPFIVEKAIQYYKNEIAISNSNVIINNYGNNDIESKLQAAKKFYDMGEVEDAARIYSRLSNTFPEDYRVWQGLFICNYNYDSGYRYYKKAINLCDEPIKSELKKEYLQLRKGTFKDCYEFDEECGCKKSEWLAKHFNSKLKDICENEWKMALRHKYMYIIETLVEKGVVDINAGTGRVFLYVKDDEKTVRIEKFDIVNIS